MSMQNAIAIINVHDRVNDATFTYSDYFADVKNGPSTTLAYDNAIQSVNAMASYWASQHGGSYIGHDAEEGGFVVKDQQGEIAMIYYVQMMTAATVTNQADRII